MLWAFYNPGGLSAAFTRGPHEALDGAVPADLYRPSLTPFPKTLEPVTHPGHFETRLVSSNGGIRWYADRYPLAGSSQVTTSVSKRLTTASSTSTSVPSG